MNDKSDLDLNLLEQAGKFLLDSLGEAVPGIPSLEYTEPDYPSTAVLLDVPGLCQFSTYTCDITSIWSILTSLGYGMPLKKWFTKCHKAGCTLPRNSSLI
ncbi:hypothetical protein [Haloferula sp.]|uniref:hypothetical protein n=1 Tax=Haloferula sp. TaxID=2497595 RepID=UPI00329CB740